MIVGLDRSAEVGDVLMLNAHQVPNVVRASDALTINVGLVAMGHMDAIVKRLFFLLLIFIAILLVSSRIPKSLKNNTFFSRE